MLDDHACAVRDTKDSQKTTAEPAAPVDKAAGRPAARPKELGGPKGPEPTRYGDWERNGRCTDF